jgi:TIR domain-containing protein
MSDIFISYRREEQATARQLADALEKEGWSVWWDPKLRAGEHFDDVIEKALNEAKRVIVLWSKRSVESLYVKDEAMYALDHDKLIPVAIENVSLPFRFRGVHTLSLLGWDGSKDFPEFRKLVDDISAILGPSPTAVAAVEEHRRLENERQRKVDEERFREQDRQ